MKGLNLCINSQTPLVRFKLQYTELLEKYGELPDPVPLKMLAEGDDYEISPGGVPKIVFPLMNKMIEEKSVDKAHWVSLNPTGPERVAVGKILVHSISLGVRDLPSYARMKERIWEEVHDLERHNVGPREFAAYAKYNWLCATKMFELLPIDVFYIHDFQQLQLGNMIGLAGPAVFRWHIPLDLDKVDFYMRDFIVSCLEAFDVVVVSCKRDLEGLIRAGYHGRAYQIYPYVDEEKWTEPSSSEVDNFCSTFGIKDDDKIILVVGRMDKIKSQDIAIKAMRKLVTNFPNAKLLLVGNGSFSGSTEGGLSHPKANLWRRELHDLCRKLKLEENVIFTGYLSDEAVRVAYKRADIVVLPSVKEGFGLTVPEAWIYKKPTIVSRGAGSSELVVERRNGYTFKPGDFEGLADKLNFLLKNSESAIMMGKRGNETAKALSLSVGVRRISEVLNVAMDGFKKK